MIKLPETIKLELRAVDFENTSYMDSGNCAIDKALRRQIPDVGETRAGCWTSRVSGVRYQHDEAYEMLVFEQDRATAAFLPHNSLIRVLNLVRYDLV